MSDGTKWQEYVGEVRDKGFNYSSPLSRLVWSCEVGNGIDQHASTDIQAIMDERADMLSLLKEIEWKDEGHCPSCFYHIAEGHNEDCKLDAMIKKLS